MFSELTVSGEVLVILVFSKLLGRRSSQEFCSLEDWLRKREEGVLVLGVIKCGKVYDIAR